MPLTFARAMPSRKYTDSSFGERLQNIRKARGLTKAHWVEAAQTTQRAGSYDENEAGFPPAPAVDSTDKPLNVTTGQLLRLQPDGAVRAEEDSEARRQRRKIQMIVTLPERDQKAVVRLIDLLVAGNAARMSGGSPNGGTRHGR